MHRIVQTARLDLVAAFARPLRWIFFEVFLVGLILLNASIPEIAIMIPILVTIVIANVFFQNDRTEKLALLHSILPLSRQDVVVGRYLAVLIHIALQAVVGIAAAVAAATFWFHTPVSPWSIFVIASMTAAGVSAYCAVTFPVLTAVSSQASAATIQAVSIVISSGLIGGFMATSADINAIDINGRFLVVVIACAALLYGASIVVSQQIYQRKDL